MSSLRDTKTRPVIIGDHVWICSNVSITKGVTIGEGLLFLPIVLLQLISLLIALLLVILLR